MKNTTPIIVAVIIFSITASFLCFLLSQESLSIEFKITQIIQTLTVAGALISAIFVISSYLITNQAFILSQKPFLLLGVDLDGRIFYQNHSNNPFYNLKINVIAKIGNSKFKVGKKLFKKTMYMSAFDKRYTPPIQYMLKEHYNIDFNSLIENTEAKIFLSYSFTFLNKVEKIDVQSYVWKRENGWNIE